MTLLEKDGSNFETYKVDKSDVEEVIANFWYESMLARENVMFMYS